MKNRRASCGECVWADCADSTTTLTSNAGEGGRPRRPPLFSSLNQAMDHVLLLAAGTGGVFPSRDPQQRITRAVDSAVSGSEIARFSSRKVPRQELADAIDRKLADICEHFPQVRLGLNSIEHAGAYDGVEPCRGDATGIGTNEKPILGSDF